MSLFWWAVLCFAIAALLGVYLLSFVLRGQETRKGIALIHGPFAAAGLVLLIVHTCTTGETRLYPAVGLFTAAALGGIFMFGRDLTGHRIPKWLGLAHGSLAIVSFALLFLL